MATVRRVRRIIRKIDAWTALKVSAMVWGGVIFWSVLDRAGLPQRLTDFMVEITLIDEGAQPFANVEQFFRVMIFGSVVWWVTMTGATVAGAIVYNLVSDVVGGLEVVVLEETLNPPFAAAPPSVLHPPADYRAGNGGSTPRSAHVDIPKIGRAHV